jgi:hypothetical protein
MLLPEHPRSLSLSVSLFLAFASSVATGQNQTNTPSPLNCTVDPNDHLQIIIRSDNTVPKPVILKDLTSASSWTLYAISGIKSKTTSRILVTDAEIMTPTPGDTYLGLILAIPLPDNADIQGLVATKTAVIEITACHVGVAAQQKQENAFKAATGKTDSDIYFNGSYTATTGGSPVYGIDSFAGYMHAIPSETGAWGKIGAYGQISTKAGSTSPAPNSYLAYAAFQRVLAAEGGWKGPFQTPIFTYRLAGGEFDQQGNNLNLVNSPMITVPLRFATGTLGAIRPGLTVPHMTLIAGVEFAKTVTSPLPEASWITRGLVGATFSTGYAPKKTYFDSILLSASYQLRLPSSPEVYYNDRYAVTDPKTGKKVTPPKLGTEPRPYVDGKVTYNFQKWVGTTFEYTYGSLPPAFVLKHSTFALGLTFTLQQTSYGRYSILKP